MENLTVKVNGQLVRHGLQNLGDEIPKVSRLVIYRRAQAIQQAMKKPGPRPTYPINWDSERQRKAYFATKGFGKGIPYRRTGDYTDQWKLDKLGEIGYRVSNFSLAARHVGGDIFGKSSNIHKGRWPNFRRTIDTELQNLPEDIRKEIIVAIQRFPK